MYVLCNFLLVLFVLLDMPQLNFTFYFSWVGNRGCLRTRNTEFAVHGTVLIININ